MFKESKRQDRIIGEEELIQLLVTAKYGVLSVKGVEDYPYGIPLHYVYRDHALWFHTSRKQGHLLEAIGADPKVCFTVTESSDGIFSKSAVIFGELFIAQDRRSVVLESMVEKFVPETGWVQAKSGIPYALDKLTALRLDIHHISGKWVDKPEGR